MWEVNVMVAASFWLGMKWRRANIKAAWTSVAFTSTLFFILPSVVPLIWQGLYSNEFLLKTTHPAPIVREYRAKEMDVQSRESEIITWQQLPEEQKSSMAQPVILKVGDSFKKTFVLPTKSIFWTKGIKTGDKGKRIGSGMLNLELLLLDSIGFDLSKNSYALNETIRILIRTITPFLVFFLVAFFTKREESEQIDRFYVKMKTKVVDDPKIDSKEMQLSHSDTSRFNNLKLFPKSDWEFDKWDREDIVGFLLSVVGVFVIIGLLLLLLSIGG
jgi:SSS family solute:Na+ symporter